MTTIEVAERRGMQHGLYVLRWVGGGASLASVGYDADARNWFAPTNWIARPGMPSFDWSPVASADPVLLEPDWRELAAPCAIAAAEMPAADLCARVLDAIDLLDRVVFRTGAIPSDDQPEASVPFRYVVASNRPISMTFLERRGVKRSEIAAGVHAGVIVPEVKP